ncbi:HGxxPAAW family protein [Streptomyces sp. NPDC093221]|uniref:HGxxPAAW family protein n=1 Tax=Streptomyces sp. NPDC093221 TaxID=3366032 RepID=UPI0037FB5081
MAVHHDHGHTPAAWTGSIISFIGFCAGGVFMVAAQPVPFWASMGVILLGPVVGGAMKLMGLGSKESPEVRVARAHAAQEVRTPEGTTHAESPAEAPASA